MPLIEYSPITKIVVHEMIRLEPKDLLYSMGHGALAGDFGRSLMWADGIAFTYSFLPLVDQTIEEYLKGTVHINSLVYAEWPKFEPMIEIEGSKIRIPFWDVSTQDAPAQIVGFLKSREKFEESLP